MIRVRYIETETVQIDGKDAIRPKLDADGKEVEIYSIEIPAEIENEGGAAIDAYVAAQLASPAPPSVPAAPVVAVADHDPHEE